MANFEQIQGTLGKMDEFEGNFILVIFMKTNFKKKLGLL